MPLENYNFFNTYLESLEKQYCSVKTQGHWSQKQLFFKYHIAEDIFYKNEPFQDFEIVRLDNCLSNGLVTEDETHLFAFNHKDKRIMALGSALSVDEDDYTPPNNNITILHLYDLKNKDAFSFLVENEEDKFMDKYYLHSKDFIDFEENYSFFDEINYAKALWLQCYKTLYLEQASGLCDYDLPPFPGMAHPYQPPKRIRFD